VSEAAAVRKGYKQTEVGVIPEDWQTTKIGNVAETSSGTTPSRALFDRYYRNGNIAWVKTLDLNNSNIFSTEEQVTQAALNETCLRNYPAGSVLVAMYGGYNQIGRTGLLCVPATVNQALTVIRPDQTKLRSDYLLRVLNFRVGYWRSVSSSSRKDPNITSKDVQKFPFPLPNLKEQEAIAEALSDSDALIESLDLLIAKKRQIKQGAMQELLTGRTRLPGFETKPGYKKTEVGVIPEDWDAPELGTILKSMQLGGNYKNSECETSSPLIKMGNLGRGSINIDKLEFIQPSCSPAMRDSLNKGDVLFNTRNTLDLVGKVAMWRNELPKAYFNSNIMRMRFEEIRVSSNSFMNNILNTPQSLKHLREIAIGTTSVAAIYSRDLVKVRGPLPTKEEQEAIATILSDMDAELTALQTKLTKARQLKQGMMQELLTGRIRLI
jgi:type I restriction enzyme, S subunit